MAKMLESGALSAFCEGVAMMLSAGIQTEEAVALLAESMEGGPFRTVSEAVYRSLADGCSLADSMEASGAFPDYAMSMVRAGEASGRLENVLGSLATYYSEEDRLAQKVRSAALYPTALLTVMTIILFFTVQVILPVFFDVYDNLAGGLNAGSFAYVNVSMTIGYVALGIMAAGAVFTAACAVASLAGGGRVVVRLFEHLPVSKGALYQMALSRFTSALSTFTASGIDVDRAMRSATDMVDNRELRRKAEDAYAQMTTVDNPKSLPRAIYDSGLFDPIHARMLIVGGRSGTTEHVLGELASSFFDEAVVRIDRLIDGIEPALAIFLTLSVGSTLIAVMLPLIGIMGSIG